MTGRCVVLAIAISGCSFSLSPAGGDAPLIDGPPNNGPDGDVLPSDAGLFDIAHVSASDEMTINAVADVSWTSAVLINTSTLAMSPALPAGASLRMLLQQPGGTEVAFLEVRNLMIGAPVTVMGSRPLIIYAVDSITLTGINVIDVSANVMALGPGARSGGVGFGLAGTHAGTFADGGGGGGSFGTRGASGGTATEGSSVANGGESGVTYGDAMLTVLEGGSSGGPGQPLGCTNGPLGGAGGGAIQLSAGTSISLGGGIDAGGGGGGGGILCPGNMGTAAGGGSGGAIYIQTPVLTGNGILSATGGAGGSGSNWGGSVGNSRLGFVGQDGTLGATAAGGTERLPDGGRGGDGAAAAGAQTGASVTSSYPNGGGGGGGHGRIFLDVPPTASITVTSTPMFTRR